MADRYQYYQMGAGINANVARVKYDDDDDPVEYAYLDHFTGLWVAHPYVADVVELGDPDTHEVNFEFAKALGKRVAPAVEPEWLE